MSSFTIFLSLCHFHHPLFISLSPAGIRWQDSTHHPGQTRGCWEIHVCGHQRCWRGPATHPTQRPRYGCDRASQITSQVLPVYVPDSDCCTTEPPSILFDEDSVNHTIVAGYPTQLKCKVSGSPLPGRSLSGHLSVSHYVLHHSLTSAFLQRCVTGQEMSS